MAFDWRNYLQLAEALAEQACTLADRETLLRCSISRAYYAAFGVARSEAARHNAIALQHNALDHRLTIGFYYSQPAPSTRMIGRTLDQLKDDRGKADYQDTMSLKALEHMSQKALLQARQLLMDLEAYWA